MKYMSATRPEARIFATRHLTGGYRPRRWATWPPLIATLLALAACQGPGVPHPRPRLVGPARSIHAADPDQARTAAQLPGWVAVDRAVAAGAIEHLVVATPVESIGARFRTYALLGPRDQPGELLVERTPTGLGLTIRLGRFGEPDLEGAVLDAVRRALESGE